VTLDDIFLEVTHGCVNDNVEVSTIQFNSSTGSYNVIERLGRRCGFDPDDAFISEHPVLIEFRSDFSVTERGFSLSVNSIVESCGGLITDNGADISSPGYPIRYNPGLNCTWEIQSLNPGFYIEIQFVKLHILPSDGEKIHNISIHSFLSYLTIIMTIQY